MTQVTPVLTDPLSKMTAIRAFNHYTQVLGCAQQFLCDLWVPHDLRVLMQVGFASDTKLEIRFVPLGLTATERAAWKDVSFILTCDLTSGMAFQEKVGDKLVAPIAKHFFDSPGSLPAEAFMDAQILSAVLMLNAMRDAYLVGRRRPKFQPSQELAP